MEPHHQAFGRGRSPFRGDARAGAGGLRDDSRRDWGDKGGRGGPPPHRNAPLDEDNFAEEMFRNRRRFVEEMAARGRDEEMRLAAMMADKANEDVPAAAAAAAASTTATATAAVTAAPRQDDNRYSRIAHSL